MRETSLVSLTAKWQKVAFAFTMPPDFMRLNSHFHDYYDTAVGFGIHDNVYYERTTKEVESHLTLDLAIPDVSLGNRVPSLWVKHALLGFCGQIYPLLEITERDDNHRVIFCHYAFAYDDFYEQLLGLYSVRKEIERRLAWQREKQTEKNVRKTLTKDLQKDCIKNFFTEWRKQGEQLFGAHKAPVWLLYLQRHEHMLTLNPKLETLNFSRLKDPFIAFQEISQYLSNILVEQKEVAVVADKYRLEQHGFDSKLSFRKEKQV